jgi:hypothetical protein
LKHPLTPNRIVVLVVALMFMTNSCLCNPNNADGDGLTHANMVASQDNNKKATLFVGISPLLLNNGIVDDFIIRFELYNIANQSRYPNATYHISIVKNEYAPNEKDRSILDGTFITRNGFLTLYINNSAKNEQSVSQKEGSTFPLICHTDKNDRVNLKLPFQLQSGQYHIRSIVTTTRDPSLSFDLVLQVGAINNKTLTFGQHMINVSTISYYDKIVDFSIDIAKRTFMWGVPFEYNSTRIDDGKVRVHEEVIIPNVLLKSMNASGFTITMNNRHFDESLFIVDPFTNETETIIHYVPKDNSLFEISNNNGTERDNWLMKFVIFVK